MLFSRKEKTIMNNVKTTIIYSQTVDKYSKHPHETSFKTTFPAALLILRETHASPPDYDIFILFFVGERHLKINRNSFESPTCLCGNESRPKCDLSEIEPRVLEQRGFIYIFYLNIVCHKDGRLTTGPK